MVYVEKIFCKLHQVTDLDKIPYLVNIILYADWAGKMAVMVGCIYHFAPQLEYKETCDTFNYSLCTLNSSYTNALYNI
jgi:hypothetical protein